MQIENEMLQIVRCKHCGCLEYYGMIHSKNGTTMCRKCIYVMWENESNKWSPGPNDYIFPFYNNGKIYFKGDK